MDKYEIEAENSCNADNCRGIGSRCHAAYARYGRVCAAAALREGARTIRESRLDVPDAPDPAWFHGFTVGRETAVTILDSLAVRALKGEEA